MVASNGGKMAQIKQPRVLSGSSQQREPEAAVFELAQAIDQADIGLVMIFFSSTYEQDRLSAAIRAHFSRAIVVGCTTAGEIGPVGYYDGGMSGVSFHRDDLMFEVAILENLSVFDSSAGQRFAHDLKERLRQRVPAQPPRSSFSFMLIDGLCQREEVVARAFHDGLGGIALVGGSAGDDLAFTKTTVFFDGHFVSDAALLLVAATSFPLMVFKTQHFVSGDDLLVVTEAIPDKRIVIEINGCPAAEEYARVIGIKIDRLDARAFAAHPVVVKIGNADFVRSIQKMNADGSLTFFCAIDEGIVFRVAKHVDMIDNLKVALASVTQRIGPPAVILGCDCILRQLESKQQGQREQIGELLAGSKVVGFSTYGEQYCGMHINQTFTGIAIGSGKRS